MNIEQQIDAILEEIIAIRRDFHRYPELSEKELRTSKKISAYLQKHYIPHQTGVAGYGIVAAITGTKKNTINQTFPVIAIRADMDALPICENVESSYQSKIEGVMHACGHDIHMAVLLGTACILKELQSEFHGTVKFFFQPAEETIGGAERMIAAGCMENPKVEAVIGLHVSPTIPTGSIEFCRGKMNATSTEFFIQVDGVSCHGAHPNQGVDVILAASHIVTALQSIVSRNLSATNAGVLTVGEFHAGTKNNILPKSAVLHGIIRALNDTTRNYIKEKLEQVSINTATALGATATVTFHDSYPTLINDDLLEEILESVAYKHFNKNQIFFVSEPSMGTEDFSYFANNARGIYFNLGTKQGSERNPQSLHSEWYHPDDSCIRSGILMEVMGALTLLDYDSK